MYEISKEVTDDDCRGRGAGDVVDRIGVTRSRVTGSKCARRSGAVSAAFLQIPSVF